jgi:copper type II ascorbate-dependent monooxygenase-like protein
MRRLFIIMVIAVAGCGSHASSPGALSYWSAIKPIADAKCVGCHTENNIAPFTLVSFADFKSHTDKVRVAVANRVMPPWPPAKNCSDYLADRSLTDDEIKTITTWIDRGAVEGSPRDYKPSALTASGLSRVDRTVGMDAPYVPTLTPDEYRCFLLDWPETATKYVSGFRARAGNAGIVHHVIAFLAAPSDVATYQQLDAADPAPGWVCFGGPGGNARSAWLGGWAPGSLGSDFPVGTGIKVQPGSKVVLQVHYNLTNNNGNPDQTAVDFKLDDSVQKEGVIQPWADIKWIQNKTMVIPAGVADQQYDFTFDPSQYWSYVTNGVIPSSQPVTFWDASLHMHTRGRRAHLEIQHADGTKECMLDIARWDFHWQGAYGFKQPKTFAPGDKLYLECHFDNSDSTVARNWGEGTSDEMCLGGFYVTP